MLNTEIFHKLNAINIEECKEYVFIIRLKSEYIENSKIEIDIIIMRGE